VADAGVTIGLRGEAALCLANPDPFAKCDGVEQLWQASRFGMVRVEADFPVALPLQPGRPDRPELVEPTQVPRRRLGSLRGRAALVHAITHIEFNAINLALDAMCRFGGMPQTFYWDWLSVAADEARHFRMLSARLEQLGHHYGDFPAHDGLWRMAERTAGSCLERMALVPRVLEARGLDVTPGMIERLGQAGDSETVAVLEVILEEEERHVEIGTRWFSHCCQQAGLDPETTFITLLKRHYPGAIRGPFNRLARTRAGFTDREMEAIANLQ